jgi:hypothetical protein
MHFVPRKSVPAIGPLLSPRTKASRPSRRLLASLPIVLALMSPGAVARADYVQDGLKLVGNGTSGISRQGLGVAISADGLTAIVGGDKDHDEVGAAWIFTRASGAWIQQGSRLVGSGAVGNASQGCSVALSADGNTAAVSGPNDNGAAGAIWVFTRTNGAWTQQGPKLVAADGVGASALGTRIALSADGNTLVAGGLDDNGFVGATWVFTRSDTVWTQQCPKLLGNDAVGTSRQGAGVAVSADGNTLLTGGQSDDNDTGAAWVFVRSGARWRQQGAKLVGTGAAGVAGRGARVALSGDGKTALVGGDKDSNNVGAVWVFVRNDSVWSQQGPKLTATDAVGPANFGVGVAASFNGDTIAIGGPRDDGFRGAVWVYARYAGAWSQACSKLVGSDFSGQSYQGFSVAISANGRTILDGGHSDSGGTGAVWVFAAVEIPTPVLASLVSAAASPGLVRIEWTLGPEAVAGATVSRSRPGCAWESMGALETDGAGRAVFLDGSVAPGQYGYRLVTSQEGMETVVSEVWVVVPAAAFALEGVRPNPSTGRETMVSFSLASSAPTSLELFDLGGRAVSRRELGCLEPGPHMVKLCVDTPLRAGIYLLRLRNGEQSAVRRIAVVR